jgi:hypothetical protein
LLPVLFLLLNHALCEDEGMMIQQAKLLPVGPMARRLRVPAKWLREEAEAGRVPCLKADRAFLFDPETTEAVLLQRARHEHAGAVQ